jgi:thymidylate synthase (FAD)
MRIIEQSHEIISLPDNLLGMIEQCGRTCYKSEDRIGCAGEGMFACKYRPNELSSDRVYHNCDQTDCKHHSSHQFASRMRDRGHHAMIEFGDITVRFITNRSVTHELVRHRLCSFAQESSRYVRYDGKMEFIRPVWWNDTIQEARNNWTSAMQYAEDFYGYLLKNGWRPEQAREVLPNSLKTEIVVKANIREVRHIFQLRCSKKAHPQIRALMLPLLAELKARVPVVFDDISRAEREAENDTIMQL